MPAISGRQVLDASDIWTPESFVPDSAASDLNPHKRARSRTTGLANQLNVYRERLERLRPQLAQASSLLLRGIIIQSRTVPSMATYIGSEELPLDTEEDIDPKDVIEGV